MMNLPCAFNPDDLFPIQGGHGVLWKDAEKAYETYSKLFGTQQSLKRLAERGGFGVEEFAYHVRGRDLIPGNCPVDTCLQCKGSGEVINSEEGGIVFICGACYGCGVLPGNPKDTQEGGLK